LAHIVVVPTSFQKFLKNGHPVLIRPQKSTCSPLFCRLGHLSKHGAEQSKGYQKFPAPGIAESEVQEHPRLPHLSTCKKLLRLCTSQASEVRNPNSEIRRTLYLPSLLPFIPN
jgi:hypothetical protein